MVKTLKNIIFFLPLAILIVLSSCNKDGILTGDDMSLQEVSFSTRVLSGGKKSIYDVSGIDYALVQIDTVKYRPAVYTIDGNIYTQSIKLPPGSYTLSKFLMMNDNNTPDDYSDDVIILATPMEGSDFALFVSEPAGFSFNVDRLKKTNIGIEVVYFNPSDYYKFGFDYDVLPATTVREQLFAGLVMPRNFNDYADSWYQNQSSGLQNEMPAIFRISVFRNGRFVRSFSNEDVLDSKVVAVSYPDGDNTQDDFRFDLEVYLKIGNGFGYKYLKSWEFSDDEMIPAESDGIVHFIITECGSTGDNVIGPYINLPTSVKFKINPSWAPGSLGSYFDGEFSDIPLGFKIGNGIYGAWCGTDSVSININHTYEMDVYSSLLPSVLPAYTRYATKWNEVNWLFNNLQNYSGYSWSDVQGAVWKILNNWDGTAHYNVPEPGSVVNNMVNDAGLHGSFIPTCGEKAAVILVPKGTKRNAASPIVQVVFVMVDI